MSLVLAGSKQHLMEALVLGRGAPLYDMLQTIALGPIELEDWLPFLLERAAVAGRPFAGDEVAEAVWARAQPVPFDVQQLAYECFNRATRRIDHGVVETAVDELVRHEANSYAVSFESLSTGERRVLRTLADGAGGSPGSSEFAAAAGLADAMSVRKALRVLADREIVVRRPVTGWRVDDRSSPPGSAAAGRAHKSRCPSARRRVGRPPLEGSSRAGVGLVGGRPRLAERSGWQPEM